MKIAVYTITKNEEKFIQKWYDSAKDADYLVILDTGSTDDTVKVARSLGISVHTKVFSPWRFDHARNESLSCVPDDADICIALDADEVLVEGWREKLERISEKTTRPRYKYVWSWREDGSEGLVYGGDKIHRRHGYYWRHPVHEVLTSVGEELQEWTDIEIHHHPDPTKSRGQYFDLLRLATSEDPEDDRNAFYYGRELFFHGKMEEAKEELKRHLSLERAKWPPERAASMIYLSKCDPDNQEEWLMKACDEAPNRREPLVSAAFMYYARGDHDKAIEYAKRAVAIKEKPLEYICEDYAWGSLPYDILAMSSYQTGNREDAMRYGIFAHLEEPGNERLRLNLRHYARV